MPRKTNKKIGTIIDTKYSGKFKIIDIFEVFSNNKVLKLALCRFEDTGYIFTNYFTSIKNGMNRKDFYKPTVRSVGIIGDSAKDKNLMKSWKYRLWVSIIERTSNDKSFLKNSPTYKDVKLDEKWKSFDNFLNDIEYILGYKHVDENKDIKFELDKDILSGEEKIYSLKTCCFIPKEINIFMENKQATNSSGYEGVSLTSDKSKYRARVSSRGKGIYLGRYDSKEEAYSAYLEGKINVLKKDLFVRYPFIDTHIKDSLLRYVENQKERKEYLDWLNGKQNQS